MRSLLHGMESQSNKAHQIEWGIFYIVCNFKVRRRVRRRSQTRSIISQLQTSNNFLTHARRDGPPQQPTPIHCDNSTEVGIANNTVKRQRSRSMETQFLWVADAVEQGKFDIKYYPGKENLGDYQSKHHIGAHHTAVRPWYLHKPTSV